MSGFLGEFLGTFVLIIFGVGIGAGFNLKKTYSNGSSWLALTFGWGMAITFGVYVAASFGAEGHLNPAVTLAFATFGYFPWSEVLPYTCGQFLGAFLGATMVIIHYYQHFKESKSPAEGNSVGIFATGAPIYNGLNNFISEIIATFMLVFVLLNLGDFDKGLKPFIVGMMIMVIGLGLGGVTGFAMNPARDWAPRLAYTILPVPNKSDANWSYAWIPMFGPIVGAFLAAGLQTLLK